MESQGRKLEGVGRELRLEAIQESFRLLNLKAARDERRLWLHKPATRSAPSTGPSQRKSQGRRVPFFVQVVTIIVLAGGLAFAVTGAI